MLVIALKDVTPMMTTPAVMLRNSNNQDTHLLACPLPNSLALSHRKELVARTFTQLMAATRTTSRCGIRPWLNNKEVSRLSK